MLLSLLECCGFAGLREGFVRSFFKSCSTRERFTSQSVIQISEVVLPRYRRKSHGLTKRKSVSSLTPTLVVCNCFIALVQLQVATVNLLLSGTTTLKRLCILVSQNKEKSHCHSLAFCETALGREQTRTAVFAG